MNTIRKRLTGNSEDHNPGYLESTAIPPILEQVEGQLKDMAETFAQTSSEYHCFHNSRIEGLKD